MLIDGDWALLRTALPELKDFLLSNALYHPLRLPVSRSEGAPISQLTIGNLLLSQARISAVLDPSDQPAYQGLVKQIQEIQAAWRSNWSQKAGKEYTSRLSLWSQYLYELRADLTGQAAYFPNEVRQRAILHLLEPEMIAGVPVLESDRLDQLDDMLRGISRQGPFVWDAELAKGFPEAKFWFLYITLKL